ncbi:hypothetical protein BH23ACT8_BH23ACT8_18030 [soil metagenome]
MSDSSPPRTANTYSAFTVDPPGEHELVTVSAGALSMVVDGRTTGVPVGGG